MSSRIKSLSVFMAVILVLALMLSACGNNNAAQNEAKQDAALAGDAAETGDDTQAADEGGDAEEPAATKRAEVNYTIGTASASGVHYAAGVLFSDALAKHSDYLRLFPQTTGGGEDNGVNVANGEYEFGFWNCDSITAAYNGVGELDLPNLRGVMTLQCQAVHFVVRNDSGIESWEDCAGKRIGVGTTNTISEMMTRAILAHFGIDADKDLAKFEIMGNDEVREKLTDGDLDMAYIAGGFPVSGIIELMTTGDFHLLSTPKEDLEEVQAAGYGDFTFDNFGIYVIPAGCYPNQDADVTIIGGRNLVFTRDDIPEEDVYEFLRVIYEQWDTIKEGHLALSELDWKEFPNTGVPLHPGAEKFYKDMGLLE